MYIRQNCFVLFVLFHRCSVICCQLYERKYFFVISKMTQSSPPISAFPHPNTLLLYTLYSFNTLLIYVITPLTLRILFFFQYVIDLLVTHDSPGPRAYQSLFALRMVNTRSREVVWLHQDTSMFEVRCACSQTVMYSLEIKDKSIAALDLPSRYLMMQMYLKLRDDQVFNIVMD